jgi:hypothetical protein
MPTITSNQGITIPSGADAAANPSAFTTMIGGVEGRLVMRFADLADRTARLPVPVENQVSALAIENRVDVFDGTSWISLAARDLYARRERATNSVAIISNAVLANDTVLAVTLDTVGRYTFRGRIYYDCSATADIRMAFTWPAATLSKWGAIGRQAATATNIDALVVTATGTALIMGGNGVGTSTFFDYDGALTVSATGSLQAQFAQGTSDPTNLTIQAGSYLEVVKVG